jgi:hypothetical protein
VQVLRKTSNLKRSIHRKTNVDGRSKSDNQNNH